jgi:hypothetical protein
VRGVFAFAFPYSRLTIRNSLSFWEGVAEVRRRVRGVFVMAPPHVILSPVKDLFCLFAVVAPGFRPGMVLPLLS